MFVINRGKVKVQIIDNDLPKVVNELAENDFFGEMSLLTGQERTATVVADEETEVLSIEKKALKPILEKNPQLVEMISEIIEQRKIGLEAASQTHDSSKVEKSRGVICSSAGNHAQGVALAAQIHGIKAVVCMAANATPSKIDATRAYGAEVVLHGSIWDEANDKAKELVAERGYTYIHPFDDMQLINGQGTVGLEIVQDWPDVDVVVVPIGHRGLGRRA